MTFCRIPTFIATLIVSTQLLAQNSPAQIEPKTRETNQLASHSLKSDAELLVKASLYQFAAPARWSGGEWLVAGAFIPGTAGAALLDHEVNNLMSRNRTDFNDNLRRAVVDYGSGWTALALSGGLYGAGAFFENRWMQETALALGTTIIVAGGIEMAMKIAVGRARPYVGAGNAEFRPFRAREAFMSFPSGHTVVAFSISTVLAERIKNPWASIGLYGLAGATSVSRIYSNHHWFSDVVFGSAFAIVVGRSVVKWYESDGMENEYGASFQFLPTLNGLAMVYRF